MLGAARHGSSNAPRGRRADTGTFADGVHAIPAVDLKAASTRDHGRSAYARDYGAQRQVQPQLIGYA